MPFCVSVLLCPKTCCVFVLCWRFPGLFVFLKNTRTRLPTWKSAMLGGRVCDGLASSKNVLRFAGAFVLGFGFFFGILFPKSPTSKLCIHVGMSLPWCCGCSPGCFSSLFLSFNIAFGLPRRIYRSWSWQFLVALFFCIFGHFGPSFSAG